jgi:hypothetical protein
MAVDAAGACRSCKQHAAALCSAQARIAELEGELCALREQLEENARTAALLEADLKRYRYAYNLGQPHSPERVAKDQLQLAFERVLEAMPPANDVPDASSSGASGNATGPSPTTDGNTPAAPALPPPSRNCCRASQLM